MYWTVVISGLAVGGQLLNVILNLKLRAAVLESEQRVLEKVERKYHSKEACEGERKAMEQRLELLTLSPVMLGKNRPGKSR